MLNGCVRGQVSSPESSGEGRIQRNKQQVVPVYECPVEKPEAKHQGPLPGGL